jgi:hypothetical protein
MNDGHHVGYDGIEMKHCLLTRALMVGFLFCSCGKDPILEAAENIEAEEAAVVDGAPAAGAPMGEEGEPSPGIPEEPSPGIPEEPPDGASGGLKAGEGTPGQSSGKGVPEEPGEAGIPAEPEAGVPEAPVPGAAEEPTQAPAGSTERPKPPPGLEGSGTASAPEPGVPEEPSAAPPGTPGGADHPGKEGGGVEDGPHITLRGRISGGESLGGRIRIDLFDGDQRNTSGPRPRVVGVHEVNPSGTFDISVPQASGRVWIGAYRDLNQNNRPNEGEPFGWYSKNPVYLEDPPALVEITLAVEGKTRGLGLDFRE